MELKIQSIGLGEKSCGLNENLVNVEYDASLLSLGYARALLELVAEVRSPCAITRKATGRRCPRWCTFQPLVEALLEYIDNEEEANGNIDQ